jgi:hypothetical protein
VLEAYTKMRLYDYSQLPVMHSEHRGLKAAVTWKSIAEAVLTYSEPTLTHASVAHTPVSFAEDLLKVVPRIAEHDFVFVNNDHNETTGIVTASDVNKLFAERTGVFLLIGEVDQRLRDALRRAFTEDEILEACNRTRPTPLKLVQKLDMGDYHQLLSATGMWEKMGWKLDRPTFTRTLDDIRELRNDVMHFNPDPIDPARSATLRGLVDILRNCKVKDAAL